MAMDGLVTTINHHSLSAGSFWPLTLDHEVRFTCLWDLAQSRGIALKLALVVLFGVI